MGFLEERDLKDVPTIPEFYKGKTLFISGGSGFMGMGLIEMLLYHCTGLERIYILLRNKRGVNTKDRLKTFFSSSCFERLRKDKPGVLESKVYAVSGDIVIPGLGLSGEDRKILINEVNIIFHAAASVRFDDTLPFAVKENLSSAQEMLSLAEKIKNLSVFVHVSTTYANTNRKVIDEIIYPPLADWRDTLEICDSIDGHSLKVLLNKYMGEMPNSYVFTKQLAEQVVYEQKGKLPIIIIRPSVVTSANKEPAPGWIKNFNGPLGLFIAGGKGIMRSFYSYPDLKIDYMPLDISIKCFIAAAWIRGTKKLEETDDIPVYNCASNDLFGYTQAEAYDISTSSVYRNPLEDCLWVPNCSISTNKTVHYIRVVLKMLLPAFFGDCLLKILGKEPMLLKIQRKIYLVNTAISYYARREWIFLNRNFLALRSCIKDKDKENFFYDLENLDKVEYFERCLAGAKRYLLNEKEENLPKARAHLYRMTILDKIAKFLLCLLWTYLICKIFNLNFFQKFFNKIFNTI